MSKMAMFSLSISLLLCGAAGCAGKYQQQLHYNPAEPIRVAVLPFVELDDKGEVIAATTSLLIDNVSLLSKEQVNTPAEIVRKIVLQELTTGTNLDVVSTALIDLELPHHGFGTTDGRFDLAKIYRVKPSEICTKIADCDAVLFGAVTNWDRSYYGVQTNNSVGIHLRLISAHSEKVLFEATVDESEGRGIFKGPTGYTSLVLEPIKGLDSELIVQLAGNAVRNVLAPLRADRPTVMQEPPAIFAVTHDNTDGTLSRKESLLVVMYGSPAEQASFSIGSVVEDIPMIEKEPGHYVGQFFPLPTDSFTEQEVRVHLRDKFGREATRAIDLQTVGLVD